MAPYSRFGQAFAFAAASLHTHHATNNILKGANLLSAEVTISAQNDLLAFDLVYAMQDVGVIDSRQDNDTHFGLMTGAEDNFVASALTPRGTNSTM